MPVIDAGLACPMCDAAGTESRLSMQAGGGGVRIICTSNSTHAWIDQSELNALQPRKLLPPKRPDIVQAGHQSITLNVPPSVKVALESKYGERLSTSLTSLLQAAAEPEMLVLNKSDLDRIAERTGAKPKSSSELFGIFFALGEETKQSRNDLERFKRTNPARGGGSGITVDLGPVMSKAVAKAQDAGLSLEEFLSNYLRDSLENDWIT